MDVVGIGKSFVDHIVCIEELPKQNETVIMKNQIWQGGGVVPTALVALARLGANTGIISVEGHGAYAKFCIEDFKRHNVDVSRVVIDDSADTSFSLVLSIEKDKSRNIILHNGSIRNITVEDLDKEYISSAKYLHVYEANETTCKAAEWARNSNTKVVIDIGFKQPEIEKMLPFIDVFIASEEYHQNIYGDNNVKESCIEVFEKGPEIVVFTLGDKGCVVFDGQEYYEVPGYSIDVMDTTGAGDVFHGAFIYGLLQNWHLKDTARFANAVSAIKCTRLGGRTGIPDYKTVKNFIKTHQIDYTGIDKRLDFYKNNTGLLY